MAFAIFFVVLIPAVVFAQSPQQDIPAENVSVVVKGVTSKNSVLIRSTLTKRNKAIATLEFWEELAVCETRSNWQDTGQYAGGLGIYTKGKFGDRDMGTWERWGGEEFAPSPDKATKAEQIIVANRVSVEGWKTTVTRDADKARRMGVPQVYVWDKEPVGFGGWGCYKSKSTGKYRMAKPRLYYHDKPHLVPLAQFYFNEKGPIVEDLQTYLRITVDGHYGVKTRQAHAKWLKNKRLSTEGLPAIPRKRVATTASK